MQAYEEENNTIHLCITYYFITYSIFSYCKTIFLKRLGYKFTREWPKTLIHKCDRFCSRQLMVLSDKIVQDMAKKEFKSVLAFDNDFHHESTM